MSTIIVTVGPASISRTILRQLREAGADRFRINLSHSNERLLGHYFNEIESCGITPAIDTQGAQLRVEEIATNQRIEMGEDVGIVFGESDANGLGSGFLRLNHPEAADQVENGETLRVDFTGLAVRLTERVSQYVWKARATASGGITLNRGVDIINKSVSLSTLTKFDRKAIDIALARGCREIYASFISSKEDVEEIKEACGDYDVRIVSKIETALGLFNAADIAAESDEILVDRGDLSREIGIPSIPMAVSGIAKICKELDTPLNIATNVLDSMMTSKVPSRAEISDIFSLLQKDISGFVLAAEVAIGENPVSSTALLSYLLKLYRSYEQGLYGIGQPTRPNPSLISEELSNWI